MPWWPVAARVLGPVGFVAGALLVAVWLLDGDDPTALTVLTVRVLAGLVVTCGVVAVVAGVVRWTAWRVAGVRGALGSGPVPGDLRWFGFGLALWCVPAAAALAVLSVLGEPPVMTVDAGELWLRAAALFLAVLCAEALPEELVFRGAALTALSERTLAGVAVAVQAALFVLVATLLRGGVGLLDASLFATMGVVLGLLRLATGSVWSCIGFHTAFQAASQLLLTQDVLDFSADQSLVLLCLGAVPFTVATVYAAMAHGGAASDGRRLGG